MDPAKVEDNFPLKIGSQGQHKVDGTVRCIRLSGLKKMISHFRFRVNFCGNLRYMIKLGVPKLMAILYVDWFMCMLNGCGRPKNQVRCFLKLTLITFDGFQIEMKTSANNIRCLEG